jgi:hypothetical protein
MSPSTGEPSGLSVVSLASSMVCAVSANASPISGIAPAISSRSMAISPESPATVPSPPTLVRIDWVMLSRFVCTADCVAPSGLCTSVIRSRTVATSANSVASWAWTIVKSSLVNLVLSQAPWLGRPA